MLEGRLTYGAWSENELSCMRTQQCRFLSLLACFPRLCILEDVNMVLTNLCLMECPALVNWNSPYPFLGFWVVFFIFSSNFN